MKRAREDLQYYINMPAHKIIQEVFKHYECPDSCEARCCKDIEVAVTDEDIKRFSRGSRCGKDVAKTGLKIASTEDGTLQKRFKEKPCPFLSECGKCGIYKQRPFICRIYPFTVSKEGTPGIIICDLGLNVFVDYLLFSVKVEAAKTQLTKEMCDKLYVSLSVFVNSSRADANNLHIGSLVDLKLFGAFLHYLNTFPEVERIEIRNKIISEVKGE